VRRSLWSLSLARKSIVMTVRAAAKVSVLKGGEVKVTKLFVVMGNVAVGVRTCQLGIVLGR
jgi:hypothetical protein